MNTAPEVCGAHGGFLCSGILVQLQNPPMFIFMDVIGP